MSGPFSRDPREVPQVQTQHRRILSPIPAPGTRELLDRLDRTQPSYMQADLPIAWTSATGAVVYDLADNQFIDFTSGIFTANVGHSNRRVSEAVALALECAELDAYDYATELRADYLDKLTAWSGYEQALLFSAGTEATECARKLMIEHGKKVGKRTCDVLAVQGAFHGRTAGVTDGFRRMPWPQSPGWQADPDSVCGVMIETFEGWDARFHGERFIQNLESWCKENQALLCFDEMQSGFARTGRKFGFEHYGVRPDLVCIGKGMGGGFPLSGVLGSREILACGTGDMSSTHSGHPMACAAGLAVIEEIERLDLVREAERKGRLLKECLNAIGPNNAKGMIAALLLPAERAARVCERAMEKGLLVVYTGRDSIKIAPPLVITDAALREGMEVLAESCAECP